MLRPGCYRLSIRQEATQPTARCHGLKRTCARAACTFVHSFRVHTGTETEREWERTTRGGENGNDRERVSGGRGGERMTVAASIFPRHTVVWPIATGEPLKRRIVSRKPPIFSRPLLNQQQPPVRRATIDDWARGVRGFCLLNSIFW